MTSEKVLEQVGKVLKEAREKVGLSQSALGRTDDGQKLYDYSTISKVENGQRAPSLELVKLYERKCSVPGGQLQAQFKFLMAERDSGQRSMWASVSYHVKIAPLGGATYDVTTEISFITPNTEQGYVIAICETESLAEYIGQECPMVDEVMHTPTDADLTAFTDS